MKTERIRLYKIVSTEHVPKDLFKINTIRPGFKSSRYYCQITASDGETYHMGIRPDCILGLEAKLIGYAVIKNRVTK